MKTFNRCRAACCSLPFLLSGAVSGQQGDYLNEGDLFSNIELFSSATRLQQDIYRTPAPVTIITREMIQLSGISEVPHLLRLAPGFVSYDIDGSRTSVTSRGLTEKFPGEMEIMINGRSAYSQVFSAVEWSSIGITVDDIDRIEIVRGSNAATQGSNAFLGAVNIITLEPTSKKGTVFNIKGGDHQQRDAQLRHFGLNNNIAYKINLNYHSDSGYEALDSVNFPWETARDNHESVGGNLALVVTPNLHDNLSIDLGYNYSRQEYPDFYHIPVASGFVDRDFASDYQSLRWQRRHDDDNSLQIKLVHNGLEMTEHARSYGQLSQLLYQFGVPDDLIPLLLAGNGISDQEIFRPDEIGRSQHYDAEFQQTARLNRQHRTVWGAGVSHNQLQGEILVGQNRNAEQWRWRIFASDEWTLNDNWLVNSGAMLEHNEDIGYIFSPRIGVNYLIDKQQALRLSLTRGKRSPSTVDFFQGHDFYSQEGILLLRDIGSDPDYLSPARVDSVDLGYVGKLLDGKLSLDVRAFYEEVDGYIGYRSAGAAGILGAPVRYRSSTRNWRTSGAETQIRYQHDGLFASLQYAYTESEGDNLANSDTMTREHYSGYLPRHNLSLLAGKKLGSQMQVSTMYTRQSATQWLTGTPVESTEHLTVRLEKNWNWNLGDLRAEVIYKSPLGDNATYYYFNRAEESLSVELELSF